VPQGWEDRTADDAQPVVIEIGMRWTSLWRLAARPWVARSALAMALDPEPALERTWIGVARRGPVLKQRWRTQDELRSWSVQRAATHRDPMVRFAREHDGTAAWGIWHVLRPG
jgi:hypothetical protein